MQLPSELPSELAFELQARAAGDRGSAAWECMGGGNAAAGLGRTSTKMDWNVVRFTAQSTPSVRAQTDARRGVLSISASSPNVPPDVITMTLLRRGRGAARRAARGRLDVRRDP